MILLWIRGSGYPSVTMDGKVLNFYKLQESFRNRSRCVSDCIYIYYYTFFRFYHCKGLVVYVCFYVTEGL